MHLLFCCEAELIFPFSFFQHFSFLQQFALNVYHLLTSWQFVLCVPLPHGLDDGFGVFVVVGLEVGSGGEAVADVLPFFGSNASDPVDGFIGSIPSGKDRLAGFVIWAEDILGVHSSGFWDTSQGKACGGKVDMFDEIFADLSCRDVGSCDQQWHVGTAVVEELFVPHVADSMVGHEEDDGVVEVAGFLESCQDRAELVIGIADAIEVLCPVL